MSFNEQDIKKVAHLARLTFSEHESPEYASNMTKILNLVDQINQAKTEGVKPMAHPMASLTQRMREDEVTERDQREDFQAIAPKKEAGLYLVPKVIEDIQDSE